MTTGDWGWCADRIQVAELEVSKQKATELLRANEGDAVRAMSAFVGARP
jgi:hypothetical protein